MSVNRFLATGLAVSLAASCSTGPETSSPIHHEASGWTVSLPEVSPTTTSTTVVQPFQVGDYTIRLVRAEDATPPSPLDEQLHAYDEMRLATAPRAVEQLASMATNNKLQVHFTPMETVKLPYKIADRLCNIVDPNLDLDEEPSEEDKAKWGVAEKAVEDDIIRVADESNPLGDFDTTMIYYDSDITRCYPTAPVGPNGQIRIIGGDASVESKAVDVQDIRPQVWLHELGHKWGLGHADTIDCGSPAQPVSDTGPCTIEEYADGTNTMGNDEFLNFDLFNGYQLARLGALQPAQIIDITTSGMFDLDALINSSDRPKLLRFKTNGHLVPGDLDDQEYYYIELSGTVSVTECDPNGSGEEIQNDPSCLRDEKVSLKVIRAADYAQTTDTMPHSLLMKLHPENRKYQVAENGQEKASATPIFISGDGVSVSLLDIQNTGKATGRAKVAITFPDN
jgi:hypothetical protein